MSQTELGDAVGVPFQQIQKYEVASNRIAASKLYALGQALSVPPGYFFVEYAEPGDGPDLISEKIEEILSLVTREDDKETARTALAAVLGTAR